MKEKILELRMQGKSYNEIQKKLGCSKSSISYHCGFGQKAKCKKRGQNNVISHRICNKIYHFKLPNQENKLLLGSCSLSSKIQQKVLRFTGIRKMKDITVKYIKDRIVNHPFCELNGLPIDIDKTYSWHLDHKVPRSRGGSNDVNNMQIVSADANQAKHRLTNDEFFELCKSVLIHNGYEVNLNNSI